MITRRDALKLGAAGLVAPTFGVAGLQDMTAAQEEVGSVRMYRGNAARTGEMPGPGPSLDKPIVVKWSAEWLSDQYSPIVQDGVLYSVGGIRLETFEVTLVEALHALTGEIIWTSPKGIEAFPGAAPSISDNVVFIGSLDNNLYALDSITGNELWRFTTDGEVRSSPCVVDEIVYIGSSGGTLYANDTRSGSRIWEFSTGGPVVSSPAISDGLLCFGSEDANFYALDAATGQEVWRFSTGGSIISTPAFRDGIVYITSQDGMIYALDNNSGIQHWKFETGAEWGNSPAVADSGVFVGGDLGRFYALHKTSGKELWRFTVEDVSVLPFFTPPSIADGNVYLVDQLGNLYVLDAESGESIWSTSIGVGHWDSSAPVVLDGHIFISALRNYSGLLIALGNLEDPVLIENVILKGAPSSSAVERGTAKAGAVVSSVGTREEREGQMWAEVTINDVTGWISLEAIDPATLPPEGEIEYVYIPE